MYFQQETLKWLSVIKSPWKGLLPFKEVIALQTSTNLSPIEILTSISVHIVQNPVFQKNLLSILDNKPLEVH